MTYRKWTREEDLFLLRASDSDAIVKFPDVSLTTLQRRRRMLKAQPTISDGVSLGLTGLERVSFDTQNFSAIVVGDFQSPFHDERTLDAFNLFIEREGMKYDAIINVGDHFDNYAISRYDKDKRRASTEEWLKEKEVGLNIFREWKRIFSGDIILLMGNHEDRWNSYLNTAPDKIREAAGDALDFENVYGLKELGVVTFPYMQPVLFGDVTITHGTRTNSTTPGSTALKEIRTRFGTNVIVGHCHTGALVTQRYVHGTAVGIENFTMADLDGLGYAMFPNWQQGFTILNVINGKAFMTPVLISNHTFVFNGMLYSPRG